MKNVYLKSRINIPIRKYPHPNIKHIENKTCLQKHKAIEGTVYLTTYHKIKTLIELLKNKMQAFTRTWILVIESINMM